MVSMGVKWPEHEDDHSPSPVAEVKNAWSFTLIRPYIFMVWCLIKQGYVFMAVYLVQHRDNFMFTSRAD
jgi:hypothetical protein